jgi:AraC-like DNA-binding protein
MEKVAPGYDPPLLFVIFLITTAFSGTFYFFLTLKLFKKLDIQIYNNFSNTAGVDLFWIRRLTEIFAVVWTALIGITVIHHAFGLFSMAFCTDGLFLSLSVFVILIGYFGFKQKIIYAAEPVGDTIQNKYAGARLNVPEAKKLSKHLKEYMEASKPYLDPELTLPQLADKVGMTTHLLSQLINDQFGMNFFDFINRYRVEEVKQKLNDPAFSHYSLLGMAFECGFNSKSAFNRVFKKSTGVTPSQFKESVHQLS